VIRFLFRLVRLAFVAILGTAIAAKFLLESTAGEDTEEIDLVNIFGSFNLVSGADPFFGGKITTAFGGTHLDLRRVVPAPTGIYLDVLVGFGGLSLVVPPGWKIVFDGALAGGRFEDLTRPATDPDAPVLRIGGLVTLAAVEVTSRPSLQPVP
jgi:hypothetical protein